MDVIRALLQSDPQSFLMSRIHLDQFYGIEIDDFACEIARLTSPTHRKYFVIIPKLHRNKKTSDG